ncbi:MAG: menaquinone biosynthesis protein [Candidatus Wallbacteria bacterium]|nr:menaquinone biosynthesis protein [Candidatus Wallbacteria bacterium]
MIGQGSSSFGRRPGPQSRSRSFGPLATGDFACYPAHPVLRVGRIDYINCDPLFEGLALGADAACFPAVPSELNRRMRAGELDISPISSIEYARGQQLYWLVPGVGISASGPIQSVLLLSPVPLRQLDGRTVYLSSESATTVVLLKILMARRFGVAPRYQSWDLTDGLPAGPVMVIGDPALLAGATPSHPHVYDLCQEWVELTGLPMTFALVCLRRDAGLQWSESLQRLSRGFQENARRWPEGVDAVAARSSARVGLPLAVMRAYLLGLEFVLTERHAEGLARYFQLAVELGELEHAPCLSGAAGAGLTREA